MLNPKIHFKSKNTIQLTNNNNIPELFLAYSVAFDGKFLLESGLYAEILKGGSSLT